MAACLLLGTAGALGIIQGMLLATTIDEKDRHDSVNRAATKYNALARDFLGAIIQ
jgi:hypothetical protein